MFPNHPKLRMRVQRNQKGMSLASVMAVGVVVMLMVSAMFATIMPLFHSVTTMNSDYKLRATSEMAIDYAIAQINSGNTTFDVMQVIGTSPSLGSAATLGAKTPWIDVPQNVLGTGSNATVKVMVAAIGNPPGPVVGPNPATPQYSGNNPSSLYDQNLELATNVTGGNVGGLHGNKGVYRMVVAQATMPGTGATRWVRAILQPTYSTTSTTNAGKAKRGYSLFGVASVVFAGQSALNTYNFTPGNWVAGAAALDNSAAKQLGAMAQAAADGGTLGKISQVHSLASGLTRSIAEGGAHYEFPNPLSVYNQQFAITGQQYNAKPATTAGWMQMYGNVYSNGGNTAYYPLMGNGDPGSGSYSQTNVNGSQSRPGGIEANVFGVSNGIDSSIWNPLANSKTAANTMVSVADSTGNPVNNPALPLASRGWSGGIVGFNQVGATGYTYPQPAIPNPQSAPPSTPNLGSVKLSNGAKIVISTTASMPPLPLGNISGKTVQLPPGDYMMTSLTLTGGSQIQIDATTQAAIAAGSKNDVNFYLQGNSPPAVAMSVDNSSSINMNGITGTGMNMIGRTGMSNTKATKSNQIAINNPSDATVAGSNINETSGNAQQLNIFSNYGSGTAINLSGNERCIIDAPYADVNIGSLMNNSSPATITNDANFYGAVFANNIHVQSGYNSGGGAFVHYDYRLHPSGTNNPWAPWQPRQTLTNGVDVTSCTGYRAVSWQEAVRSSVGTAQTLAPGLSEALPSDLRWSYNF